MIWIVFIAAQLADVWTTNKVLSQGGREMNPLVQWLMDRGLWPWGKVAASVALTLGAAALVAPEYRVYVVAGASFLTGAIALNNYRQIK